MSSNEHPAAPSPREPQEDGHRDDAEVTDHTGDFGDDRSSGDTLDVAPTHEVHTSHDLATGPPAPGVGKKDPILVADNISRSFGGIKAVDVEHLEIPRNAITALIDRQPTIREIFLRDTNKSRAWTATPARGHDAPAGASPLVPVREHEAPTGSRGSVTGEVRDSVGRWLRTR